MFVKKTDNVNFGAGKVCLDRISPDKVKSFEAIKKIAEDKGLDVFISKNKGTKHLPSEDVYLVMATKESPVVARGFFEVGRDFQHGASCAIMSKKTKDDELSVRIFNATMNAIDKLEKKLTGKK